MHATNRTFLARLVLTVVVIGVLPVGGTLLLLAFPRADVRFGSPDSHFVIVSVVALLAVCMALAVVWAARTLPDHRTFFLSMGFLAMAVIFAAHGLGTSPLFRQSAPGEAEEYGGAGDYGGVTGADVATGSDYGAASSHSAHMASPSGAHAMHAGSGPLTPRQLDRLIVVGYSAQLSVLVSAWFFAMAVVRWPAKVERLLLRRAGPLRALLMTALAGHVAVALYRPELISWLPIGSPLLRWSMAAASIAALAFAGWRFLQAYRLAYLPLQGAMAAGMLLLAEAQLFMDLGRAWQLSWWNYHFVMLAGFVLCVGALLRQYHVTGDLGAIVEGLFLRDQVGGLKHGDPRAMAALGAAVAAKDSETAGHIERVGDLAVAVGRRLGLDGERLELLRWAGRLHDVGKIGVPDAILGKAGPLTEAEFEVIKLHSPRGWSIALHSSVLARVAPIIRAHHERLDGTGYPDGLVGPQIPLEARIVAVADVWDALTCDRPYRKAMAPEAAARILADQAGPHLDARCVEALLEEVGVLGGARGAA